MGQNRSDSKSQVEAKRAGAKRRQCPECGRKNALSSRFELVYADGWARECRYCGYVKLLLRG